MCPQSDSGEAALVVEPWFHLVAMSAESPPEPRIEPRAEHMFRAAPMSLVQMYVTRSIARDVVGRLGALACVHFEDLNQDVSAFARLFVPELRQIDETVRHLRELERLTGGSGLPGEALDPDLLEESLIPTTSIAAISDMVAENAERLGALARSFQQLTDQRDLLLEERTILRNSRHFFGTSSARSIANTETDEAPLLDRYDDDENTEFDIEAEDPLADNPFADPKPSFLLNQEILAGVIERTRTLALERLCWRVTRGNLVFNRYPIEDTLPGSEGRDVFMVYTHGSMIGQRVLRICESLDARIVRVNAATRDDRLNALNDQLGELFTVIDQTEGTLRAEQEVVSQKLPFWKVVLTKEHAIYETLNLFSSDQGRHGLIAEAWIPTPELPNLQTLMSEVSSQTSQLAVVNTVQTSRTPPTYHTTNKVTAGFQGMVDIYGISRHGEVNPGLPTVVTFPFLFAVMFGDVGHGFIMFLGAFALVRNEAKIARQKNRNEILDMAFVGRYVLLFMGLFSIFTGFMYNDIFSRSMTIFSSGWEFPKSEDKVVVAKRVGHRVYPFGLDWAWHGADNNLRFTNSYKMKLSVLLGFVHMTYSLMFQYVNARHFRSWVDIWGNFVPSLLFMQSLFGYLSITIVYKWCVDWIGQQKDPPGLLDMLIKMFLSPGTIDPPLYRGQAAVQIILLILALLCVPWLLLFKPLYLRKKMKEQDSGYAPMQLDERTFAIDEDEGAEFEIQDSVEQETGPEAHVHESFGDIMIHQVIHTIEFCLNCVSHTASYLRLWALSLAHSQLSIVLWNMTLRNAFGPTGGKGIVMVVFLFGMWFVITVMVLVCMEGTSAMLHALRLQWVEAMSKHFEGEGYTFQPLNLHGLSSYA